MDSKAAKVAVQICIRLVKHVLPETISDAPSYYDHYCMLFGNEMLTSALQCVHDPYHQEVHSDAISLITIIYVRLLLFSEHGLSHGLHNLREVLASLPGKARVEDLVELEAKMKSSFGNKLALKEQTALIRTFLNGIKGISISQWGAKKSSFLLNASEKEILKRKAKDTNRADILDSEDSNITLLHNQ